MDKEQAIQSFWEGYGNAYDESTVPRNAKMPYITYSVATGAFEDAVALTASIWDRSTSWKRISQLKNRISEDIGIGGKMIKIDGGYMWIKRNGIFAQRMSDEDDSVRRIYLQLTAEFLTAN